MNARSPKRGFAARPGEAESWIKAPERPTDRPSKFEDFSARLTIDVTPDMRGRIKIAAFQRGETVAEMLRALFEREFPTTPGDKQ